MHFNAALTLSVQICSFYCVCAYCFIGGFFVSAVLLSCEEMAFAYSSAQIKTKALNMLGFWKSSRSGRHHAGVGRSSANSTPGVAASVSVEARLSEARESVEQHRTTADVNAVVRPSSLRRTRQGSLRRSPTTDDARHEKDEAATSAAGLCMDRSVQTSEELLQPLISHGLRQRRRHAAADADDARPPPPVRQADSLEDIVGGACRPWRRHSLSSLSPLSSRLASPVQETPRPTGVLPSGDLNLDDVLGDGHGVVSPASLSPLSIAEMSSPPRRWRAFESRGGGAAFPLRCYDADDGRRWAGDRQHRGPPAYQAPNYVVGLPAELPVQRATAQPPLRAPLRRQKPYVGSAAAGRPRAGIVVDVDLSPASSSRSGDGGGPGDSCSEGGAGAAKSTSALSLEDAINRSLSRLSDDNNVITRARRTNATMPPPTDVTRRRTDVTRNDVTVTSRRPARPVVLSSDV